MLSPISILQFHIPPCEINEDFSQSAHESLLSISDEDLRGRYLMDGKDVAESLESPRIRRLGFFGKEKEATAGRYANGSITVA